MKNNFCRARIPSTAWLLPCALLLLAPGVRAAQLPQAPPVHKTFLVWSSHARAEEQTDQEGFSAMLSSVGLAPVKLNLDELTAARIDAHTLVVVPNASAKEMTSAQADRLLAQTRRGARVMTDGDSPLLRGLNLTLGAPRPVQKILYSPDLLGEVDWSASQPVPFLAQVSSSNTQAIYTTEKNEPLVLVGALGQGSYMAIGPLFDPSDGRGYARFPNVINAIVVDMGAAPLFRRNGVDAYVDLSDRGQTDDELLAHQWARSGIRTIYVSAWYFDENYDYDRLIAAAHRNGILIYPWFQWPHVSRTFWNNHPEWREKTATLADANVDWRLLMNFQNPDCLRAVLADAKKFLLAHDWDGVNIAEFYFESYAGPDSPEIFTPMNPIARAEFKKESAFDPVDLFVSTSTHFWQRDKAALPSYFYYRVRVMNRLYDTFVAAITSVSRRKRVHWPLIVTTIDALTHPELGDYYNTDMEHLQRVLAANDGTLQLEDEFFDWKLGPDRYTKLGRRYAEKFPAVKFMIDVNVVSEGVDPGTRFPTLEPTGSELAQIYRAADRASAGVAFYSEHSVRSWDWPIMPYAMASDVRSEWNDSSFTVSAPYAVVLSSSVSSANVDGRRWGCGNDEAIILPAGEHVVRFDSAAVATSRLYLHSISGELMDCNQNDHSLRVAYHSAARCIISLNSKPRKITVDGKKTKPAIVPDNSHYILFGPAGIHKIQFDE